MFSKTWIQIAQNALFENSFGHTVLFSYLDDNALCILAQKESNHRNKFNNVCITEVEKVFLSVNLGFEMKKFCLNPSESINLFLIIVTRVYHSIHKSLIISKLILYTGVNTEQYHCTLSIRI